MASGLACRAAIARARPGGAMRHRRRAELARAALTLAIQRRRPGPRLIPHSHRGSQYAEPVRRRRRSQGTSRRKILQAIALTHSISRKANCCDNAPMESFVATLKTNLSISAIIPTTRPRGATCSPPSKPITIGGPATPPSAISPHSRHTAKPHSPLSTLPGDAHCRPRPRLAPEQPPLRNLEPRHGIPAGAPEDRRLAEDRDYQPLPPASGPSRAAPPQHSSNKRTR
jgi:transposase InsO family protein